ncbi:MAG: hypothetical protein AAGF13_08990, partial [Pseudomonadota bacterium]
RRVRTYDLAVHIGRLAMIRPEARKVLMEWREVILGAAFVIIGGNWILSGHTLQPILGALFVAGGLAFIWLGYRRVRFPVGESGIGLVEVTERRIAYMTAAGGGAVAIDGLARVEVTSGKAGISWVLTAESGEALVIPGNARGAEALFDALVPLPGINYDQAVQAARAPSSLAQSPDTFLIWQKDKRALH